MNFWDTLDPKYRVILCDVWGVIHDGVNLYPGARERLGQWRAEGRRVVLITNAPRPADSIERQLGRIGLPNDAWDGIASSGEAGIEALNAIGQPVGFVGTRADRAILEARGVLFADEDSDFTDLACTGLEESRPRVGDYRADLERWAERGVRLHCLNPDRVVIYNGVAEACAGAIADVYQELGGRVTWYGKPHEAIYRHALQLAGNSSRKEVLAVGDSVQTDALGAARMGLGFAFVTGGIHAGEPFPTDFASTHELGDWRPVAVVEGLA